ncbi:hypothetical protein U4960_05345 [Altererythrobacter sp. H2]|uniref:hypothetical protein n=1 Tax=Altererythrobacter sp. H2 TaxID=3108391 RepID=UPI002B4BE5EC|nr:hypothetical protein [Altererythrobacter sp. H2]WRK96747.1 hypothetical protein U4960_05345 [Altererythrobacter sp. H2]
MTSRFGAFGQRIERAASQLSGQRESHGLTSAQAVIMGAGEIQCIRMQATRPLPGGFLKTLPAQEMI